MRERTARETRERVKPGRRTLYILHAVRGVRTLLAGARGGGVCRAPVRAKRKQYERATRATRNGRNTPPPVTVILLSGRLRLYGYPGTAPAVI